MVKRDRNVESENLKKKRRDLRKRSTLSERHLWQWLRQNEFDCKFRRQFGIGKYIVDFYCHEPRLIIELDGPIHNDELILFPPSFSLNLKFSPRGTVGRGGVCRRNND